MEKGGVNSRDELRDGQRTLQTEGKEAQRGDVAFRPAQCELEDREEEDQEAEEDNVPVRRKEWWEGCHVSSQWMRTTEERRARKGDTHDP